MKRVLGLDLGTNSIGWGLVENDLETKQGKILGNGSRIIPISQDILDNFGKGQSHSQTAERTGYRGVRRLGQRTTLRRERLHRVLNVLDFLPKHYANSIDFEKKIGQFKEGEEVKLNYFINQKNKHEFLFKDSFNEMVSEFKTVKPELFYSKRDGKTTKIPYDWTLYYLRKKALSKKITKEELAWLILNFNQKRGYYQLRGEDENEENKLKKEFVENLTIEKIEKGEPDKKNKDKNWYTITFKNKEGWSYETTFSEAPNWKDTTKEFLITEEYNDDGSIKITKNRKKDAEGKEKRKITPLPSFEEIESMLKKDQDKIYNKIKVKTEITISKSEKTVGQYIYETLLENPTRKIRGKLVRTIERKFYKDEFQQIISKQIELQPNLFSKDLYKKCVEELYPNNKAHANHIGIKSFDYLFTEDIIFYQRPLKSQKSNIANCQYEYRIYKHENKETKKEEEIKEFIKAIPKSHPLFQEFRLWQFIHNLKIYIKKTNIDGKTKLDVDITNELFASEDDWVSLFDFLKKKKEIEQKHVINHLVSKKRIPKSEKDNYCWNYVEDKKYPGNETCVDIINRLEKVNNLEVDKFLSDEIIFKLWHIIYSVTDKIAYEKALETFARKQEINEKSFVENFKKIPSFKSDYGAYSEKAIKKLLPLMRLGKYWNENEILETVKEKVRDIEQRLNAIKYDVEVFKKDENNLLDTVIDDAMPRQILKSFVHLKDKNHLAGLNTYQACYLIYERHSESDDMALWKTPNSIDKYLNQFKQHSLRNPIVEQVVTETLRTVRDIWQYYGDGRPDYFNEIHIELGRDMKNPAKKRKQISETNNANEKTNQLVKKILKELMNDGVKDIKPYSRSQQERLKIYEEGIYQNPKTNYTAISKEDIDKIRDDKSPNNTKKDIEKYKLWLEQGYISPYTGCIIPLSGLFSKNDYEIDHIIPQSKYFDDSLSNKVICETAVNGFKDNTLPYDFIKKEEGKIVNTNNNKVKILSLDEYQEHCDSYFKKNKAKLNNLLADDIPEGFINRQMNDSRYISKLVKELLSKIVREEDEQEATSKHVVPVIGSITSKLKQDWGLNDKWNELITPRFERLNKLTESEDYGKFDEKINTFRPQVPDEISKGFSKKRIDHRHHSLDALVIACCTKEQINYLNSLNSEKENYSLRDRLLIKNKQGDYTKHFMLPWNNFPVDCKKAIENTIVSFKQNLRVINKNINFYWAYKNEDGKLIKKLRKQTKGDNWAIRKPLHKETVSGKVDLPNREAKKGSFFTATRKAIDTIFGKSTELTDLNIKKRLEKITDTGIQKILKNYLTQERFKNIDEKENISYDVKLAFSPEKLEYFNKNIAKFNEGKNHHPIYKVRIFEESSKQFPISEKKLTPKSKKMVETAKGTNLFFAVYWDDKEQKRNYETIPLNKVIAHQKEMADLPKKERTAVPVDATKGKLVFVLSPNDLVYVPEEGELNKLCVDAFKNLNPKKVNRIYKMVSCTETKCYFISANIATLIKKYDSKTKKGELESLNKLENTIDLIDPIKIKEKCIKLKTNRLGNIIDIIK